MNCMQINGYNVVHFPMPKGVVNARIIVEAGSAHEEEGAFGAAHFLEHMFFKGTSKRDHKEINRITSRLGDINAYTSLPRTVYHFTFRSENFAEAMSILAEMVFDPSLPEEELKKEIGTIVEERQMYLDSPSSFFWNQYLQHVLGRQIGHSVIGTLDSIRNMTVDKLRTFMNRFYNPANMMVAIAGDVQPVDIADTLGDLLPKADANPAEAPNPTMDLSDFTCNHTAKQAMVNLWVRGIPASEVIKLDYAHSVLFNGLTGGLHSLMYERLREDLGLCYSVHGSHDSSRHFGYAYVNVALDEDNIDLAEKEMLKVIDQVRMEGFSPELLELAKENYLFSVCRSLETSASVNRRADSFADYNDYDWLRRSVNYKDVTAAVMKIKNENIIELANRLFGDESEIALAKMTHSDIFPIVE